MKKTISVILSVLFIAVLTACLRNADDIPSPETDTETEIKTETETATEPVTETAPPFSEEPAYPASLYENTYANPGVSFGYTKVSEYYDDMSGGRDVCVLSAFPSEEDSLSGFNLGTVWHACAEKNGVPSSVRIGYLLEFDTPEGKCEKLILRPSDITDKYWDYIETYIYDDIHQEPGAWYSHLQDWEYTDETTVTSVKLTAGEKIASVSDLKLTAFAYDLSEGRIDADEARARGNTAAIVWNPSRSPG